MIFLAPGIRQQLEFRRVGIKDSICHVFEDPAACLGTDEEVLACFRRSRDNIRDWIETKLLPKIGDAA
jgi:hypothetical protein